MAFLALELDEYIGPIIETLRGNYHSFCNRRQQGLQNPTGDSARCPMGRNPGVRTLCT
jgi:hypothetical protein